MSKTIENLIFFGKSSKIWGKSYHYLVIIQEKCQKMTKPLKILYFQGKSQKIEGKFAKFNYHIHLVHIHLKMQKMSVKMSLIIFREIPQN